MVTRKVVVALFETTTQIGENMAEKKDDNQIVMYTTQDGQTKIRVNFDPAQNTAWLTQAQMVELFQTSKQNVSLHINNIFEEGELDENSTVKESLTVQKEGNREVQRKTNLYNLDVIISVGYRVKSLRGTQFRIWATKVLHEYIKKGFAMNDELLKEAGGGNYFKELLERIRDIRSSEKVLYRQVLELFATSMDYDAKAETAQKFFKTMQNKLHFATSNKTAAEIIAGRANAELPFMGLTVFKGNRPTKNEVVIAKNYLTEEELFVLNRLVSAYFDTAEVMAKQERPMYMKDWIAKLDELFKLMEKGILQNAGTVSHIEAEAKALGEYEKYKQKPFEELTQVEKDFLDSIRQAQKLIESKTPKGKKG